MAEHKKAGPYKCYACGECFWKAHNLRDHRRRKHTKEELATTKPIYSSFKCEDCGRGHQTINALRKHRPRCKQAMEKTKMLEEEEEELS